MRCFTKGLTILVWLFLSLSAASAADEQGSAFPYGNLKIFPHWLIACDNLEECSAIGLSFPPPEGPGRLWHITAKWHKGSDIINFSFSDRGIYEHGETPGKIAARLCQTNAQCRPINADDKMQVTAESDFHFWPVQTMSFTLDATKLEPTSYLVFNAAEQYPIYFKDLLDNRNNIKVNYLPQLGGKREIYNIVNITSGLRAAYIKKIYPQYPDGDAEYHDNCLTDDYIVTYENGDKFLFACHARSGRIIAKYNGTIYKTFSPFDEANGAVISHTVANGNIFNSVSVNIKVETHFIISDEPPRSPSTGTYSYDLAYDGKNFIIATIRYMPLDIEIPSSDWPVLYKRPS